MALTTSNGDWPRNSSVAPAGPRGRLRAVLEGCALAFLARQQIAIGASRLSDTGLAIGEGFRAGRQTAHDAVRDEREPQGDREARPPSDEGGM